MTTTTRCLLAALVCGAAASVAGAQAPPTAWRPAGARLLTRWAADVDPDHVLPEYPRPQMTRARWQSLNGLWQFAVVNDSSAPLPFGRELAERILVPFAMESALSGVGRHADQGRRHTVPGRRLILGLDSSNRSLDSLRSEPVRQSRQSDRSHGYSRPHDIDGLHASSWCAHR